MSQLSNLFLSLGKTVKDEYGRSIGRIISFATTPNGKFDSAFIELSDGRFIKQPVEALTFNGNEITFISQIKAKAAVYSDQIPFIWRKDQALKELADKKKIAPDLYQELHGNFSALLSQLRKDAQELIDKTNVEIDRCEEEMRALSYGVLHLELEHEIGKISEEVYKSAFAVLQENVKRTTAEKADLENTKTKLSNLMLGEMPSPEPTPEPTPKASVPEQRMPEQRSKVTIETPSEPEEPEPSESTENTEPNEPTELPEPPVVVYVKEVGKAGI
jgi:hypothetical protein